MVASIALWMVLCMAVASSATSIIPGSAYYIQRVVNGNVTGYLSSNCKAGFGFKQRNQGLPSQWTISKAPGSSGHIITSAGCSYGSCPAVLGAASPICSVGFLKMQSFPTKYAIWHLKEQGANSSNYNLVLPRVFLGQNCSQSYLGAPTCSSKKVFCPPSLLDPNGSQDIVWTLSSVIKPKPQPPKSASGLDYQNPGKHYLFEFTAANLFARRSAYDQSTNATEGRDLQLFFNKPSSKVIWFLDKPRRQTGFLDIATFISEFSWTLKVPNVIVRGSTLQGETISTVLALASPSYNSTTKQARFSASIIPTDVSPFLNLVDSATQLYNVSIFVDSAGDGATDVLDSGFDFGSQLLGGLVSGIAGYETLKSFFFPQAALNDIINAIINSTIGQELQNISTQVDYLVGEMNILSNQIVTIVDGITSGLTIYDIVSANQTVWDQIFSSMGDNYSGIPGTIPTNQCPVNTALWPNQMLLGSTTNIGSQLLIVNDAITTAANAFPAYIFNLAGQSCQTDTAECTVPYSGNVPGTSPAALVVESLNSFIAVQIQGLQVCNTAANYSATTPSCNSVANFYSITSDYCVSESGLGGGQLLTDIVQSANDAVSLAQVQAAGFLWRDFNIYPDAIQATPFYWPPANPNGQIGGKNPAYNPNWAINIAQMSVVYPNPAGQLLTSIRFVSQNDPNYVRLNMNNYELSTYNEPYDSTGPQTGDYISIEANFFTVSIGNSSNSSGYVWSSPSGWTLPFDPPDVEPIQWTGARQATGGTKDLHSNIPSTDTVNQWMYNPNAQFIQYIDIAPVMLPPGVYATGVSLITYQCSSLPTFAGLDRGWSGGNNCGDLYATFTGIGSVLGLQITGAMVSFNLTTGEMVLSNYSSWSNEGNCGSNFISSQSGVWTLDANGQAFDNYFPAPVPYAGTPQDTNYQYLQLFDELVISECDMGPSGGSNFYNGFNFESSPSQPEPSFVSGAQIWLKGSAMTIGIIGSEYPINGTSPYA